MSQILWETNVGSHMWRMNHDKSDFDIFQAYVESSREILRGTASLKSSQDKCDNTDYAIHEIEHIIRHRLKGNVNFLWGIHSPIIITDSDALQVLRGISAKNISKNCFHSINGLAKKNMKKYIEGTPPSWEELHPMDLESKRQKKSRIIYRTLHFGIVILKTRLFEFRPIGKVITPKELDDMKEELNLAYDESELPESPDEEPFREFLENVRIKVLQGELMREMAADMSKL